jgi:hypothetical protein
MGDAPRRAWRYLLVDVDGTLLDSRGAISPRNRRALRRAVDAGLTLVLASGRTYPSLLRVCGDLDVPYHLITNGGAVGLSPHAGAVLYTSFLDADLWPEVAEALLREGLHALVFSHRHPEHPLFYVASRNGHPHFEAYLARNDAYCRVVPDLPGTAIDNVVEVAALGEGPAFDAASAKVLTAFRGRTRNHSMVLFINATFGKITEFFHPGSSKWHAFLGMFPDAAAHHERVIAIGDEANDLEMIRDSGYGIAMGNGTADLKAVADHVTADHDHDGVALALEDLLGVDAPMTITESTP